MDANSDSQAVLDFWFGAPGTPAHGTQRKEWFVKDAAFDAQIRERFLALHARADAGGLAAWEGAPESLLALIIVFDQFPRNMFRDTPRAFASDARALAAARRMVERGWDTRLPALQRGFVYLPFEHCEDLAAQEEALRLFGKLAAEEPASAESLEWARKHHEVVQRFGRFPHRNAILGRASTPQEEEFLREPGSRF